MSAWDQDGYGVRADWGPAGAARLAPHVACLVVVDVLSFTTAVSAAAYADSVGAQMAAAAASAARPDVAIVAGERWPDGSLRPPTCPPPSVPVRPGGS